MEISFREMTLTDASLQITHLKAWDSFIDNECETLLTQLQEKPVAVISNVRLKELNGHTTIATTQSSELFINPDVPEAKQLESWKLENAEYLQNMWSNNGSASKIQLATIKEISEAPYVEQAYYIKAFIATILAQEQCWYISCNSCHKKAYHPIGTIFSCGSCQRHNVTAEPWCCVKVELGDNTGNMAATPFGNHAEKVLACEATSLANLDVEGHLDLLERWSVERTATEFIFHVKVAQLRNTLRLNIIGVDIIE